MQHLLALRHLGHRERDAGGPGADHEPRAFAIDRFLGAPRRRASLRGAVARDVLDRATEYLHVPLFERHAHPAVVQWTDVGEGPGLVPQTEDDDLLLLCLDDRRKAEPRRGASRPERSNFQDVPTPGSAHARPSFWKTVRCSVLRPDGTGARQRVV